MSSGRGLLSKKIAQRVRTALAKERRKKVVDLAVVRESRRKAAEDAATIDEAIDREDVPVDLQVYMRAFTALDLAAGVVLQLDEMSRFADAIADASEEYDPGGPPDSAVTDSMFHTWSYCDLAFGLHRESVASIATETAKVLGVPDELIGFLHHFADSRLGLYRCLTNRDAEQVARVQELVTEQELLVLDPSQTLQEGDLVLCRLLPPVRDHRPWVAFITPYVIEGTNDDEWRAYFARIGGSQADAEVYARVMKAYDEPRRWLEYVTDGFAGTAEEDVLVLEGIPDRPETLPSADPGQALPPPLLEGMPGDRVRRASFRSAVLLQAWIVDRLTERDRAWVARVRDQALGDCEEPEGFAEAFLPLLLYVVRKNGRTMARRFLSDCTDVADDVRRWIEAAADVPFSVFEIVEVETGRGLHLHDLLRGGKTFVEERIGSEDLAEGTIILARMVQYDGVAVLDGLFPRGVPTGRRDVLLARIRDEIGAGNRTNLSARELQAAAIDVVRLFAAMSDVPELVTHDGEALVLCSTLWEFDAAEHGRVLEAIRAFEQFTGMPAEKPDEVGFAWREAGRALGSVTITPTDLRLVTHSRGRHDWMRNQLERVLDGLLRHERTSEAPFADILALANGDPPEPA